MGITPANNSFIVHDPSWCSSCLTEWYCFSNSTESGVGEVVFPDGNVYSNVTGFNGDFTVERLDFSVLHIEMLNLSSIPGLNQYEGVFTCKLPDSFGNILETSIGLYTGLVGMLTQYRPAIQHIHLTPLCSM